jgi:hypothetical protein
MKKIFPLLLAVALCGCATGSITLTGTARPQIAPENVRIFAEPPGEKYEIIGIVTAYDGSAWTVQGGIDKANRQLQQRAAKYGANGIIVKRSNADPWRGTTVEGTAIFILPKDQSALKQ